MIDNNDGRDYHRDNDDGDENDVEGHDDGSGVMIIVCRLLQHYNPNRCCAAVDACCCCRTGG